MNTEITKHTVGPWTIAKVGTEHLRIASTKIPLEIAVITNLKGGMKEANARLIAAAPAQHEALERIEELSRAVPIMSNEVQRWFSQRPELEAYRCELNGLILKIRMEAHKAIAAAKGQSHFRESVR